MLCVAGYHPTEGDLLTGMLLFIAVFFGSAGCFLTNDYVDRKKDLSNNKQRPIATGALSPGVTLLVIIICLLCYLGLSLYFGPSHIVICLTTITIFLIYSPINNKVGFGANALVALSVCLAVVYGAIYHPITYFIYLMLTVLFLIILAREIMLDVLDMKGDREHGKSSIPLRFGIDHTKRIIFSCYMLLTFFSCYIGFSQNLPLTLFFLLLSVWLPFGYAMLSNMDKWALFNVRWSHLPLLILILVLFLR